MGGNISELKPLSTCEAHLSTPPTVASDLLGVDHPIRCLCDTALEVYAFQLD